MSYKPSNAKPPPSNAKESSKQEEVNLPSAKTNWMTTNSILRRRGGSFWDKKEKTTIDHREEDVLFKDTTGRACKECGLVGHTAVQCTNKNLGLVKARRRSRSRDRHFITR